MAKIFFRFSNPKRIFRNSIIALREATKEEIIMNSKDLFIDIDKYNETSEVTGLSTKDIKKYAFP